MPSDDPYRWVARVYDRVIEPMQVGVRRAALRLLPPDPSWQVLDVGCGTGAGLAPYVDAGCAAVGLDVSAAMLARAHERFAETVELHLTDGGELPFADNRFDLVTTSLVLHEVPADQRSELLDEMVRVTAPRGKVLVIDFAFGPTRGWKGRLMRGVSRLIERVSGHYDGYLTFRDRGGFSNLATKSGLDVEREKLVAGGNLGIYLVGC